MEQLSTNKNNLIVQFIVITYEAMEQELRRYQIYPDAQFTMEVSRWINSLFAIGN